MDVECGDLSQDGAVGRGECEGEEVLQIIVSVLDLASSLTCEKVVTKVVIGVTKNARGWGSREGYA